MITDPMHERPAPVAPPDILYRLQSIYGRALRCEHEAEAAHDSTTARAAHAVAQKLAVFMWGTA
jgi:hypothetical protein